MNKTFNALQKLWTLLKIYKTLFESVIEIFSVLAPLVGFHFPHTNCKKKNIFLSIFSFVAQPMMIALVTPLFPYLTFDDVVCTLACV